MSEEFDLVVIGAGPGGYVAAIRAAQLGFKVACIESRSTLGGTCLNVGCMPSKALLHSSALYKEAKDSFASQGIEVSGVKLNLNKMMENKNRVVSELTKGIESLFKKNKITSINGFASIVDKNTLAVTDSKGNKQEVKAKRMLIATGSVPTNIPNITIDEKYIVSSTGALELATVPKNMVVIGGGVIGLEMGSIWSRLGAKVTVVEFLDKIVPAMDSEIGKELKKVLESQDIEFELRTKVNSAKVKDGKVQLEVESVENGEKKEIMADVVLVAIGRKPFTEGLGLEKVGIKLDAQGRIEVNEKFVTNVENIFAIGDVIKGPMLAHKAEDEGVVVAEIMSGQYGHVDYNLIPSVIYTEPEVASIGRTEDELKKDNIAYKSGKFSFKANSRARAIAKTDGFVKILACAKTDEVLGAHIIGEDAGTIIHEIATAMEFRAASEDIARTCHAHPTLNEAVKEAAMAVTGKPINS